MISEEIDALDLVASLLDEPYAPSDLALWYCLDERGRRAGEAWRGFRDGIAASACRPAEPPRPPAGRGDGS